MTDISRRKFSVATTSFMLGAPVTSLAKAPLVFRPPAEEANSAQNVDSHNSDLVQNSLQMQWLSPDFWNAPRSLWLFRQKTGENIREVYFQNGQVYMPGYLRICQLLRDVTKNKAAYIDLVLLDILRGIQGYYELKNYTKPVVVLSGYRTKETNDSLENAAKNSMHLIGRAIDMYMPSIPLKDITWFGDYFKAGGVGVYPSNNFLHLDTGRVRRWTGASHRKNR